eukprot:s326_g13.t1
MQGLDLKGTDVELSAAQAEQAEQELWRRAYQLERERAELLGVPLEEAADKVSWQASFEELRGRNAKAERQRREELAKKELEAAQAEAETATTFTPW